MSSESAAKKVGAPTAGKGLEAASERKYLKWYNKVGYGSGDVAGNVVYVLLSGGGLSLAAVGPTPFSFNASRYTQEELAARRRNTELTPSGSTVLCLDAAMAGIGSNSCGPALRPRYQVDSQELGMELHLLLNPHIAHTSTHNEVKP